MRPNDVVAGLAVALVPLALVPLLDNLFSDVISVFVPIMGIIVGLALVGRGLRS